MRVLIEDADSRIEFVHLELDLASFMRALTGLAYVECDMETNGLEHVGKLCERKELIVEMPDEADHSRLNRVRIAYGRAKQKAPEGYTVSSCFGSQDSFFRKDDRNYARTTMTRWVEKTE